MLSRTQCSVLTLVCFFRPFAAELRIAKNTNGHKNGGYYIKNGEYGHHLKLQKNGRRARRAFLNIFLFTHSIFQPWGQADFVHLKQAQINHSRERPGRNANIVIRRIANDYPVVDMHTEKTSDDRSELVRTFPNQGM